MNISGQRISYDPGSPAASAEWVKHNLNRVRDSLPNGYCGRPAQQDCPHPNACLTCPDFQTTPEFLQIHRRQAAANSRLIAQADAAGKLRLAENPRRVQANLDQIIPALQALQDGPVMNRADNSPSLAQANARRHQAALAAARHAIEQLRREGKPVNYAAVAHAAGAPGPGSTAKTRSATSSATSASTNHRPPRSPRNAQAPARSASGSMPPAPRSPG